MSTTRISTTAKNAALDAIAAQINAGAAAGTLKIYTGAMPATPGDPVTGTLLAELTLSDPCAPAAAGGVLTFSAITQDSAANNTGIAGYARIADSDGNGVVDVDVTATGGGGALTLNTVSIVAGVIVTVTSFTLSL